MKKLFVLFIAVVAGAAAVVAQEAAPQLTFKTAVHDFGKFPEETGKVTCTFEFKNTGQSDLILQNVRASCGCTTPNWTKTPVRPGETGVVEATYNAAGRPGTFSKTITVTSNAGEQRLTIKGDVTPRVPKTEDQYPFDMSGLRLKTQSLYLNNIEFPNAKAENIEIINNTEKTMTLSYQGYPPFLSIKAPASLGKGEKGMIEVTFDSKSARSWGIMNPEFLVVVNGKVVEDKKFKITVFANIVENFATLTAEQKANAPVITVDKTVVNIGVLKAKSKQTTKVAIGNSGKNELLIRKAYSDNNAISVVAPKSVKSGKTGDVKVEVNTVNMKPGKFSSSVMVITNDPNKSVTSIIIEGEVK